MTTKRNGFTLIEIMVVIAMIGIIMAISVPRISSVRDRTNLRAARDELATALATARSAAVQKGTAAQFIAVPSTTSSTIEVKLGTGQQIMPQRSLTTLYNATFTVDVASDQTITYDTRGFASRTNTAVGKYRVQVGSVKDSVCISKLGLVSKLGCVN